jgi:hypothetical protein
MFNQGGFADGGARFLEVDSHNNFELATEFLAQFEQLLAVFEGSIHIMDGA